MTSIKIAALKAAGGNIMKMFFLFLCPAAACLFSAVLFVYPGVSLFFGREAVFDDSVFIKEHPAAGTALLILMTGAGIIFIIISAALRFYGEGRVLSLSGEEGSRPCSLLSIKGAFRYIKYRAALFFIKLMWILLFFSPFCLMFLSLALYMNRHSINRDILIILLIFMLLLFALGLVFFRIVSCRYYLCSFLLYQNPLEGIREVIESSVLLTKGKTSLIIRGGISILPWKAVSCLALPLPFSYVYIKFIRAEICRKIYYSDTEA